MSTSTLGSSVVAFLALGGGLGSGEPPVHVERQKLLAPTPSSYDEFGHSVDVSGEWLVVGMRGRAPRGGAAIFRRDPANDAWVHFQDLAPSGKSSGFGTAVAIDGAVAIVGAPRVAKRTAALPTVYVYAFDGTTWSEQQQLVASANAKDDLFGDAVALDGGRLLVGAPFDAAQVGAAYLFERTGSTWIETQRLVGFGPNHDIRFGTAVALQGDDALVGAPGYHSGTSGHVYRFARDASVGSFAPVRELESPRPRPDARFGVSVALEGALAVVGENWYRGASGTLDGAAYVYSRTGTLAWDVAHPLEAPARSSWFGNSVAVRGRTVLVGAPLTASGGSAYVHERIGDRWTVVRELVASDAATVWGGLGKAVALDAGCVVATAPGASSPGANQGGAVYLFESGVFELLVDPTTVGSAAGAAIECVTTGGQLGSAALLAVVDVSGTPTFVLAATGGFAPPRASSGGATADSSWRVAFDVAPLAPPGLSGETVTLRTFGTRLDGRFAATEPVTLAFE